MIEKVKAAKHLDIDKNNEIWAGTEIVSRDNMMEIEPINDDDNINNTQTNIYSDKSDSNDIDMVDETECDQERKRDKKRVKKNKKGKKKKRKIYKPKKKRRKIEKKGNKLNFDGLDIDNSDDHDCILDKLAETILYIKKKKGNRNKTWKSPSYSSSTDQSTSDPESDSLNDSDYLPPNHKNTRKRKRKLRNL